MLTHQEHLQLIFLTDISCDDEDDNIKKVNGEHEDATLDKTTFET